MNESLAVGGATFGPDPARSCAGSGGVRAGVYASVLAVVFLHSGPASAAEGGSSAYLPGKRGPLAAFLPKPGTYLTNDIYFYDGSSTDLLPVGGRLVQRADAQALINIAQFTWITEIGMGGGRLALTGVLPIGTLDVSGRGSVELPDGSEIDRKVSDGVTGFGDPAVGASLGWKNRSGDRFRAWSVYGSAFIPIGDYQLGRIANLGKNRWALDVGGAFTMANVARGREFSSVLGFTFNGDNLDTDYSSGTEMHLELAGKQHLPRHWAFGVVGYWYEQLTGDSNNSPRLGDFKGRVFGIGPEVSYQFTNSKRHPVSLDFRWYHEFGAENRLEGDAVFLTISVPIFDPVARDNAKDWSQEASQL